MTPASTLKLVVAASALDTLGPQHRFETRFVADAIPDESGTLRGGLWLVGGGDPTLASSDLLNGIGFLYHGGLRRVDGSLEVDDSAFSGPEQNPRWDPSDLEYDYAAGTSAISLDEGTIAFDVTPGGVGGTAEIRPNPPNTGISFAGAIRTTYGDSFVTIERRPEPLATGTTVDRAIEPHTTYDVDGHIAAGATQTFLKPVLGMPGYVGGAVMAMLAKRQIGVAGGFRPGVAPLSAVTLWSHRSPTLEAIVREMLVNSNNHTAETLLRILGETSGRPGTDGAGIAFEKRQLDALGVPRPKMALYDGSGLAPSDRIAPLTLAKLIINEARSRYGAIFVRSLPLVGLEGTVKRHDIHLALGRTRAKSGHIEGVNGLAGTIETLHHGRIAFAFIVNDPDANAGEIYDEEDRALDALAAT